MRFLRKYSDYLILLILAGIVFFLTYSRGPDLDTWYHIKLGEVFIQKGLLFHDIFSFSALGRPSVPYEWLFQVFIYSYQKTFGIAALGIFVAFFSVLQILFFYIEMKRIFSLHWSSAFLLSVFYFVTISNYLIQRPTVVANLLFLTISLIVFLYVYKQKNFLWIGIPIMLIWTNFHASFVLGIGLTGVYAVVCLGRYLLWKPRESLWRKKGLVLLAYSCIFFLISVLPPLEGKQYMTFLQYASYHNMLISITEWRSLYTYGLLPFWVYTIFIVLSLSLFFTFWRRNIQAAFLLFPMSFLLIAPYLANRNMLYGMFAVMFLFACSLSKAKELTSEKKELHYLVPFFIILFSLACYLFIFNPFENLNQDHYPQEAATFIVKHNLKGNMLNDYKYGGYLLYRLYPMQKVFIDGRGDMYLCCELPQLYNLTLLYQNNDIGGFQQSFSSLLNRYHISFVVTTRSPGFDAYIMKLLSKDPQWSLVYWDDSSQIFVRKDGENTNLIQEFGADAATPYGQNSFDTKRVDQAIKEYSRMISVTDSAISRNNLGLLYAKKDNLLQAASEFKKAMVLNKDYQPSYINLAFVDIRNKNFQDAAYLLNEAKGIDPTNPLSYIYLGEIDAQVNHDMNQARSVWEEGIQNTTDLSGREKLNQLLISN